VVAGRVVNRALAVDFRAVDLRAVLLLAADLRVDVRPVGLRADDFLVVFRAVDFRVDFRVAAALRARDLRVAAAFLPAVTLFGDLRAVLFFAADFRVVLFFAADFRVAFRVVFRVDFRVAAALRARDLRVAAAFLPAATLFGDLRAVLFFAAMDLASLCGLPSTAPSVLIAYLPRGKPFYTWSMPNPENLTRDEALSRARLIHDVRYEVALDLTSPESFVSQTLVRFGCAEPGGTTHLDLAAISIESVELNGQAVPAGAVEGNRIHLSGLAEENEARVVATCAYNRTELGMHRFQDPVDGEVYLHTHLEPFGAHRVFACFDQPDLKGEFRFGVLAQPGWEVVSNAEPAGPPADEEGGVRWTFGPTRPMPTYVTAVCAGPFHAVRDRHGEIDLGIYCRRSLAVHLDADELLEVTKAGFDFFEGAFGYAYPFGKYDQLFIPESNSGAMENAGCITFNDAYIFRSRVTDAARERRADTVLHEMAHMWFGDLVTMRWWNDLWLNESFASYMGVLAQVEATRWKEGWTTFTDTEKTWAYRQDQLPTTHPIVADIPDVVSIHLNFDGITYAKGASVLKQLVAWVGREQFLEGVKVYCRRHEFGNAELRDFLAALEETSGRDLQAWSKEWLESAGVNTLLPQFEVRAADGGNVFASFAVVQEAPKDWPTLRSHRVGIGLYDRGADGLKLRRRVELDVVGERTQVSELEGDRVPDLVLVNDGDLTFAKIRLDPGSLETLTGRLGELDDSLARTLCWTACWDMTRDAEIPARDYLRLVIGNIGGESQVGVVQSLLGQAASAINLFGHPANRDAAMGTLAEASLEGLRAAASGSDHQLAWARSFISAARRDDHLALLKGLRDGSEGFGGLEVDTELRWHVLRALAAAGKADDAEIRAELKQDPTDKGTRHAAAARAARPSPEAKAEAWRIVVEESGNPLALIEEVMGGFQQFGQEQELAPYAAAFFEALPRVWESRDLPEALAFGRSMYPRLIVDSGTIERTDRYLSDEHVPAPVRRLLLEGRDGLVRAMRARAVDAAAAQKPPQGGPPGVR
jgi:aminopeptidase N